MLESPEIRLLRGFGPLNFGENEALVRSILGEPEELQILNDAILNTNSVVFHYWKLNCSIFFDHNKNQQFCSIETDNKSALLFDLPIFTLKEKEIISLMKEHQFLLSETETHPWGEKRISFDEACLDCYFENNRLISVNFSAADKENVFPFLPN